jgi:hypothetical protein
LHVKRLGPFKILKVIGESKLAFKLELPQHMHIHLVFHSSLLEPYHGNTIPGRTQPPSPPIVVENHEEFEVERILDSKITNGKLKYLVDWTNYGPNDRTWEPPTNLIPNATEAIKEFHTRYPNRASPADLPQQRQH